MLLTSRPAGSCGPQPPAAKARNSEEPRSSLSAARKRLSLFSYCFSLLTFDFPARRAGSPQPRRAEGCSLRSHLRWLRAEKQNSKSRLSAGRAAATPGEGPQLAHARASLRWLRPASSRRFPIFHLYFPFASTFSYLWLRRRYCASEKMQASLRFSLGLFVSLPENPSGRS